MTITFLGTPTGGTEPLPLYSFHVATGFPLTAADHLEGHISLDELFDLRAPHVYLVKVEGDSMQGAGGRGPAKPASCFANPCELAPNLQFPQGRLFGRSPPQFGCTWT